MSTRKDSTSGLDCQGSMQTVPQFRAQYTSY